MKTRSSCSDKEFREICELVNHALLHELPVKETDSIDLLKEEYFLGDERFSVERERFENDSQRKMVYLKDDDDYDDKGDMISFVLLSIGKQHSVIRYMWVHEDFRGMGALQKVLKTVKHKMIGYPVDLRAWKALKKAGFVCRQDGMAVREAI